MPRCLLMLLGTFLLVLSTVVAASIPSLRQRRADQKQLTLSGDDIVALERILADVDKVLGSVQVKLCSSSEANSAQCKLAAQASRPGYTPDNIARELKSGERKRWAPSCYLGGGSGSGCRMGQLEQDDLNKDMANSDLGPGKRRAINRQSRKRWAASCYINPGPECRMDQIADNDDNAKWAGGDMGPGKKRNALSAGKRKRWSKSCHVAGGMSGNDCRMSQVTENEGNRAWAGSDFGPGKRSSRERPGPRGHNNRKYRAWLKTWRGNVSA